MNSDTVEFTSLENTVPPFFILCNFLCYVTFEFVQTQRPGGLRSLKTRASGQAAKFKAHIP